MAEAADARSVDQPSSKTRHVLYSGLIGAFGGGLLTVASLFLLEPSVRGRYVSVCHFPSLIGQLVGLSVHLVVPHARQARRSEMLRRAMNALTVCAMSCAVLGLPILALIWALKGTETWGSYVLAAGNLFVGGIAFSAMQIVYLIFGGKGFFTVSVVPPGLYAIAAVILVALRIDAILFCGMERIAGGRRDEQAAIPLARQLRELGVAQGRLKTGTPPRLDGRTIDWSRLAPQPSDHDAWSMSAIAPDAEDRPPELGCAIARTNGATHNIIASNLDRSPLFAGAIEGRGPRYCPSIEDKIKRFGDRDGHQIFLEPEGLTTELVYPNGISTSLPADVQQAFVNSIAGLERCQIVRPGYAVEYEYADARKLLATLEHGSLPGLFLAGQVNGTTGYEEAAAQGLVAGLNAAAVALDLESQRFDRRTSYIGVMVDDLTLQGVTEPYRMMTARAEHRLALRADNATTRLGRAALASGATSTRRHDQIISHFAARDAASWTATEEGRADALYAPYIARQDREWAAVQRDSRIVIPDHLDFRSVPGLSNEAVERLEMARPETIDQASRVHGITPAALAALHVAASRRAA